MRKPPTIQPTPFFSSPSTSILLNMIYVNFLIPASFLAFFCSKFNLIFFLPTEIGFIHEFFPLFLPSLGRNNNPTSCFWRQPPAPSEILCLKDRMKPDIFPRCRFSKHIFIYAGIKSVYPSHIKIVDIFSFMPHILSWKISGKNPFLWSKFDQNYALDFWILGTNNWEIQNKQT